MKFCEFIKKKLRSKFIMKFSAVCIICAFCINSPLIIHAADTPTIYHDGLLRLNSYNVTSTASYVFLYSSPEVVNYSISKPTLTSTEYQYVVKYHYALPCNIILPQAKYVNPYTIYATGQKITMGLTVDTNLVYNFDNNNKFRLENLKITGAGADMVSIDKWSAAGSWTLVNRGQTPNFVDLVTFNVFGRDIVAYNSTSTFYIEFDIYATGTRTIQDNGASNVNNLFPDVIAQFKAGSVNTYNYVESADIQVIDDSINDVGNAVNDVNSTLTEQRQQEIDKGNSTSSDVSGFVSQGEDLKGKWEILWLPISYTQQVFDVIKGGSSSTAYVRAYHNVYGYTYNEKTGFIEPVIGPEKPIPLSAEGKSAKITFPEYTLPVLNLKVWDSYTFDLAEIKEQFPILFDAIYVISGALEVVWVISFLFDKFMEVFRR